MDKMSASRAILAETFNWERGDKSRGNRRYRTQLPDGGEASYDSQGVDVTFDYGGHDFVSVPLPPGGNSTRQKFVEDTYNDAFGEFDEDYSEDWASYEEPGYNGSKPWYEKSDSSALDEIRKRYLDQLSR